MQRSEQINELAAAMSKAQSKIEGAVKGNTNPAFRSKYADLGAVWDAVREPLGEFGLSVFQELTTPEDNKAACTTLISHASGQWILLGPLVVPVNKNDAQGFGSACTYLRRYSLMAAVGIAPIDDDGQAAVGTPSKPARTTPVGPPPEMQPSVSPERARVVRKTADTCIAKHAKKDEWGVYEAASEITDSEERLLLWEYLRDHSEVRSSIKESKRIEDEKAKALKVAA